jgi:DUF4097 and DUF4098 domain-containing protein YvlB
MRAWRGWSMFEALVVCIAFATGMAPVLALDAQSRSRVRPDAQRDTRRDDRADRTDTAFVVARGAVLDVNVMSSKVSVRGWDRSDIGIHTEGDLSGVDIMRSSRGVRVESGMRGRGGDAGDIEIRAPRGTRVVISARQGDLEILDVRGSVNATMISGDVVVRGGTERTVVNMTSGDVKISNTDGTVTVESISGSIALDDVRGDVHVSGTSSDVTMSAVRAARVEVNVMSGEVSFAGPLALDGRYQFSSHSGDVHVHLATDAKGILEMQSFNGELHAGVPVVVQSGSDGLAASLRGGTSSRGRTVLSGRPQRMEFGGGGSAQITISTFSGDVYLDRGVRR